MTDWMAETAPYSVPQSRCPHHGTPIRARGCFTCRIVAKRGAWESVIPHLLFAAYIVALCVAVYCVSRWPIGAR